MARLEYFLVCETVSTDRDTNQTTIVNVFEDVPTPGFPIIIPKCTVIALFRWEAGDEGRDFQAVVRVTPPGEGHRDFNVNFRPEPNTRRHRVMQRIMGLSLSRAGDLRFEILLNGEHKAEHVVTVLQSNDPGAALVIRRMTPPAQTPQATQ